jgi:hypothetical protein
MTLQAMKRFFISMIVGLVAVASPSVAAQEKLDLEKLLVEAETVLAKVDNYTATFHKQERVKGKLLPTETIFLKFKHPFKVYLKWLKAPHKGQESLYVQGANGDKIKGHGSGLATVITLDLHPTSSLAMADNRHPLTEIGLEHLIKVIGTNVHQALKAGELATKDHGEETVFGRTTRKIEGILPKDPAKGYYCHRCVVNLDLERKVPIKIQVFDGDDLLVEGYGFENLVLNAGLTDADFNPKNSAYGF